MSLRPPLAAAALVLLLGSRAWAQAPGTPVPTPVVPPEIEATPAPAPAGSMVAIPLVTTPPTAWSLPEPRREPDTSAGWVTADYMLMWLRNGNMPILATTSPGGTAAVESGVIGPTGTRLLIGNQPFNTGPNNGLRLGAGFWLPDSEHLGAEVNGFFTESRSKTFNVSGSGAPGSASIARPFIDATTGKESAALTAFEGQSAGTITAGLRSELWGTDANLLYRDNPGRFADVTYLAGFRYLDLYQNLNIQENSTPIGGNVIPFNGQLGITNPDRVRVTDQFKTSNQFFGAQIGTRMAWEYRLFTFGLAAKLGLGTTHETLHTYGISEAITANGQVVSTARGGFYTNPGNIGSFSRDAFSVVPEVELKAGIKITANLSAFASYNFLYWSDVASPTDQVNRTIDLRRVPTSALFDPTVTGRTTNGQVIPSNFWANSVQVGFVLKY